MIDKELSLQLPQPWRTETFQANQVGSINFLVGPNGSGKSKFAETLRAYLGNARFLGTDRLRGMEQVDSLIGIWGDHLSGGYPKNLFNNFKTAGLRGGGIDTVVLLEERLDLRIEVEATLSQLFNRKIFFEWDSGNLMPKAILGSTGNSYRLDRDECHGIKELLVLLTHLYNRESPYLIIDEPELNLHPQYQAFFMQEVRKVAGDPAKDASKKIVFLVTHSPFILDFRSIEDVQALISFSLDYSVPRQLAIRDPSIASRLTSLVPRLNVHHKQLFFSDNPVFVEGILDAQLLTTMQETRGVSVPAAGSCIIDAGGAEEVNKYLELCSALAKKAHFLYDLDSLFSGSLRACVKTETAVESFLLTAGVGNDFARYCGQLDSKLTELIDRLLAATLIPDPLKRLKEFLNGFGPREKWDRATFARARVAVLTAISKHRTDVVTVTSETDVADAEARLKQIVAALQEKRINLLPGGTLERYLPAYSGDEYDLTDDAKRQAVQAEMEHMASPMSPADLATRYGELYDAVCRLPSKVDVDVDAVLKEYLSDYIHYLQLAVTKNPKWTLEQVKERLNITQRATANVFSITELTRSKDHHFTATISIASLLGKSPRVVHVSDDTNAGTGDFKIESA